MARTSFYTEIGRNKRDSILLTVVVLFFLISLVFAFSKLFFPETVFVVLLLVGIIISADAIFSYLYGDRVVLSSTGAKPADPLRQIYLLDTVEGLALAAGIPKPKVYVIPSKDINAFATGRDPEHASIAVTQGALDLLNQEELEGVIAHEMSHIGNYDIRFFTLIAVFVGLVAILSHVFLRGMWYSGGRDRKDGGLILLIGIVLAVIAPIIVRLVQLSISRKREYLADATGVRLTRYPPGLANALEKIAKHNSGKMNVSDAVSHLFISDPKHTLIDNIFATHPPIEKRIAVLRSM